MPHYLEAAMLICFGASWPFAIIKTVRAKNPAGKSYLFAARDLPAGTYIAHINTRAGNTERKFVVKR